jgi:CHRD domain-containing protein
MRNTRKVWLGAAIGALLLVFGIVAAATAGGGGERRGLKAHLSGYQEVPAISTAAEGRFKAKINGSQIDYKLSFSGLSGPVKFAHIHFAQPGVNGGVAAFLCGGGSKPPCPQSGEVTGTIVASDVIGPIDQGIALGEIDELIAAMRAGATYANVHSDVFPNGEIRGQIGKGRGHFGKGFGFGQKRFGGDKGHGDDEGHGGGKRD